MIYSNFFTPPLISMLFCLHESTVEAEEKDPRSDIVQFLIKKILSITDACSQCASNQQFEAQLMSVAGNTNFLNRYRQSIAKIQSFNDFYREMSKMLKTLRSLRNNKLQQGNLIDFLVRRMYIYFEKLDFKEIIKIYQRFDDFRRGVEVQVPQHEFMLTKSIEEIKYNLEHYNGLTNPEEIWKKVTELKQYDHTNKSSYLVSVVRAEEKVPIESVEAMHRYFDKSLGNLFQEKSEVSLMSNKINHCILSNAFINIKMEGLEECLQSISEGLRISQNNSDEESINNCIIYLYRIAQQLGKHQEEILLNEHAITHSVNLSNILLMVYSCFNYSLLEKNHNCNDPNILLLKHRNINWTDALHFSKKKLFSTFESNCKNIYHTHRSLLIPTFISKLAVLIHLPQLTSLLLNPYYMRPELLELQIYREFQGETKLDDNIRKISQYAKTGQSKLLQKYLQQLETEEKSVCCPFDKIKIRNALNRAQLECEWLTPNQAEFDQQIELCHEYGFVREELLSAEILCVRMLMCNEMFEDALVKLEEAMKHCKLHRLQEFEVACSLLRIQVHLRLDIDWNQSIIALQVIEHENQIMHIRKDFKDLFFQTHILLNRQMCQSLKDDPQYLEECQILTKNQLKNLESLLELQLKDRNFIKARGILRQLYDIFILFPNLMSKRKGEQLKLSLAYLGKALNVIAGVQTEAYDEEELLSRMTTKLIKLYFS